MIFNHSVKVVLDTKLNRYHIHVALIIRMYVGKKGAGMFAFDTRLYEKKAVETAFVLSLTGHEKAF